MERILDRRRWHRGQGLVAALLIATLASACGGGGDRTQSAPAAHIEAAEEVADTPAVSGDEGMIDGSITYPQRITLPRGAKIVMELFELSGDGGTNTLVTRRTFAAESQVPIPFRLDYDRSRISSTGTYGIRARILVDGALWFVNSAPEPVLTRGNPATVQIVVQPAPVRS
jgi:putative lipoprotein